MYLVYILKCSDDSYYTGSTNQLDWRVAQHQIGDGGEYTSSRLPVTLVYACQFETHDDAFRWGRQIKGWSRKKKEALISKNWEELVELSKNRSGVDTRKNKP